MVVIVTATLAAILYGAGAVLQQRQAASTPAGSAGRPRLLVILAQRPLWLLGLAAEFGGFALHAVALRFGPLAIVQMLVTPSLIVSVATLRIWSRRPLGPAPWTAAGVVVAGVAMFTVLTTPRGHGAHASHEVGGKALLAVAVLGVSAVILVAAGLRATEAGRRRAVLLAVAASLGGSAMAVITLAFAHAATRGLVTLLTSWPLYAVVAAGIGGLLLTQTAYQADQPLITLAVISAVTPVVSVAVGWGILGESLRLGPVSEAGAALAVTVTSLALAVLARASRIV
jgi:drug/metabolite transporter (DMT)-like permease